jgi:Ca2+/Na+ antiporter
MKNKLDDKKRLYLIIAILAASVYMFMWIERLELSRWLMTLMPLIVLFYLWLANNHQKHKRTGQFEVKPTLKYAKVRALANDFYNVQAKNNDYSIEGIELATRLKTGSVFQSDYAPLFEVIMHEVCTLAVQPCYQNAYSPTPSKCMRIAVLEATDYLGQVSLTCDPITYAANCKDAIERLKDEMDMVDPDGFGLGTLATVIYIMEEFIEFCDDDHAQLASTNNNASS